MKVQAAHGCAALESAHAMSISGNSFSSSSGSRQDIAASPERPVHEALQEALLAGDYCLVLTPSEMGKLARVRAADHLREAGISTVVLHLAALEEHRTADSWYQALLDRMGQQLGLQEELAEFWQQHHRLSPLQRWMAALQEVVLRRLDVRCSVFGVGENQTEHRTPNTEHPGRLVIFIDEIDAVRGLPFSTDEFFAAIRECYNRRTQDPEFLRLTFCLMGAARLNELIRDTRTTAFNIGRRFELSDADSPEIDREGRGSRRADGTTTWVQRAIDWICGEPYAFFRSFGELAAAEKQPCVTG